MNTNSPKDIFDINNIMYADNEPHMLKMTNITGIEILVFIHIRVHQRNGRKCITTVENLESFNLDKSETKFLEKVSKKLRKKFSCGATVKDSSDGYSKVIQLSGDNREKIKQFLIDCKICSEEDIKMHGF